MTTKKAPFGGGAVDLTTGPIARSLLVFSLPALGSNVLQSINGSVNAIWIGQFLGERGLAATANANMITFMMISMVFGFGMASTIVIGQAMGRKDVNAMREAFGTGVAIFLMLGVFVAVTGWIFSPALLQMLGTHADAYPMALIYLRWMFLGMPFMLLSTYLALALRSVGDSMTPLILMLPGLVVDIVLNPILILGLGPAPRMGIAGSGVPWVARDGDNALVCPAYDPPALAATIDRIMQSPELASAIATRGRERFVIEFTRTVMVRAYLDLLESGK